MKQVSCSRWYPWLCWHSEDTCSCSTTLSWASYFLNYVYVRYFFWFSVLQMLLELLRAHIGDCEIFWCAGCIRVYLNYSSEALPIADVGSNGSLRGLPYVAPEVCIACALSFSHISKRWWSI